jgi:hypothetical protein
MRLHPYALCAALVLPVTAPGCASLNGHPDASNGVGGAQPIGPAVQDHGRAVLIEADRQMKDLQRLRDDSPDSFTSEAMTRQYEDLRARSDRLLDDMTVDDARAHDTAIRADVTNLQRSMRGAANAEKQGEPETNSPAAR